MLYLLLFFIWFDYLFRQLYLLYIDAVEVIIKLFQFLADGRMRLINNF